MSTQERVHKVQCYSYDEKITLKVGNWCSPQAPYPRPWLPCLTLKKERNERESDFSPHSLNLPIRNCNPVSFLYVYTKNLKSTLKKQKLKGGGGSAMVVDDFSPITGSRSKRISVSLRTAGPTYRVLGQPELHSETLLLF